MSFFNILPRNPDYQTMTVDSIPLRVVFSDGVKVSPDIKFNKIDLAGGQSLFKNNSGVNDSFTITVLLHKDDVVNNATPRPVQEPLPTSISILDYTPPVDLSKYKGSSNLITALDYWIRNAEPFYIRTDAVGIPANELWLVTEQKNRKQERNDGYVWWDLTFTLYREVTLGRFNKNTTVIDKALEKLKSSSSNKNTDSKTQWRDKLKKCDYKTLVYSEKKKTVTCVKYMQELLYLEGCFAKNVKKSEAIDSWYGKTTREAVKAYKKKYRKDYGLNEYGNSVDYKTWQVMCGTAKKVETKSAGTTHENVVKKATTTDETYGTIVNVNAGTKDSQYATVTVKSTAVQTAGKTVVTSTGKLNTPWKTAANVAASAVKTAVKTSSSSSAKSSSSNKNSATKTSNKNTTTKKG
jgi:hypothetical protein